MSASVLVTGAGGFIGHHLVSYLKDRGYEVRGADLKAPEFELNEADEFQVVDLRERAACDRAVDGVEEVYHLAADMGGIGYITGTHAPIARNNTLMNLHHARRGRGGRRRALPLLLLRLRLPAAPAGGPRRRRAGRGPRLARRPGAGLRAGEALQEITKEHDLTKPQGVRGRNSDNGRLREVLGWEPEVTLEEGIARTYRWIEEEVERTPAEPQGAHP